LKEKVGENKPLEEVTNKPPVSVSKQPSIGSLINNIQKISFNKSQENLEISTPTDVKHEIHIESSKEGFIEIPDFVDSLNKQLLILGASSLSPEELEYIKTAYIAGPPKTAQEAKNTLQSYSKQKKKKTISSQDTKVEENKSEEKDIYQEKYSKLKKKFKKLLLVRKDLQERNHDLEMRLITAPNITKIEEETNNLKEKLEFAEQTISKVEESKQQLDLELTEMKIRFNDDLKNEKLIEDNSLLKKKIEQMTQYYEQQKKKKRKLRRKVY